LNLILKELSGLMECPLFHRSFRHKSKTFFSNLYKKEKTS